MAKPIIRWAGGKRSLVPDLVEAWHDDDYKRLIEPFSGAASLFFRAEPKKAILNDACDPLINFYKSVRNDPKAFLKQWHRVLKRERPGKKAYYRVRDYFNNGAQHREKAALFLYLNRLCFHGLWRVNKQGVMNTPYGHYAKPKIPTDEEIMAMSEMLKRATITKWDFRKVFAKRSIGKGDFVYADPPYYDTFDGYTQARFTHDDHAELAELLLKAAKNGAAVLASNRDCKETRQLYRKKHWHHIPMDIVQKIAPQNGGKKPEMVLVSKL